MCALHCAQRSCTSARRTTGTLTRALTLVPEWCLPHAITHSCTAGHCRLNFLFCSFPNPGLWLPAAPPPALSAALDAGYLPCLERTLRRSVGAFSSLSHMVDQYTQFFGDWMLPKPGQPTPMKGLVPVRWSLLLPYGSEREAAALLVTFSKIMRQALEHASAGTDREACVSLLRWFCNMRHHLMYDPLEDVAAELVQLEARGSSSQGGASSSAAGSGAQKRGAAATRSSRGSSDKPAAGTAAPSQQPSPAVSSAVAISGGLSAPVQQLLRLLSFAVPYCWLPLFVDLPALSDRLAYRDEIWRSQVNDAVKMLELALRALLLAMQRGDMRAAESWRAVLKSMPQVKGLLSSWRARLERERAAGRSGDGDLLLLQHIKQLEGRLVVVDPEMHPAQVVVVEESLQEGWFLLELLAPPCDARQVLPFCSNPRCAELAGDSEAGVVLMRCGGACGGAAAYCCAACQRAHWAAGHKEECGKRGRGRAGAGARPWSQAVAVAQD